MPCDHAGWSQPVALAPDLPRMAIRFGTYFSRLYRAPLTAPRALRTGAALCQALTGNAFHCSTHRCSLVNEQGGGISGEIDRNGRNQ